MRRVSVIAIVVVIGVLLVSAFAQTPNQVRKSELKSHPFDVGNLKLTISSFHPNFRDIPTAIKTPGSIELQLANPSGQAKVYEPKNVSLVGADNKQVNLRGRIQTGLVNLHDDRREPIQSKTISPGARVKELYDLTGSVKLPARLFYGDKELAVITD